MKWFRPYDQSHASTIWLSVCLVTQFSEIVPYLQSGESVFLSCFLFLSVFKLLPSTPSCRLEVEGSKWALKYWLLGKTQSEWPLVNGQIELPPGHTSDCWVNTVKEYACLWMLKSASAWDQARDVWAIFYFNTSTIQQAPAPCDPELDNRPSFAWSVFK